METSLKSRPSPQTVLITGAASGIGRAAARLFAEAGWRCVLVDHDTQALQTVAAGLPAPELHLSREVDLRDRQQVAGLREGLPTLDAVINNAGVSDSSNMALVDQPAAQLQRLLAVNLEAPAAVVDACMPLLAHGARIVNVSSGAGLHAIPWRGLYSPSKAGVIAQTQALARARPDLCVTVLCPGFVRTELVESLMASGQLRPEGPLAKIPLGRMASPEEMARALCFLATTGAAPLHGQKLAVNGGSSVYGGTQVLPAAQYDVLPLDLPLHLEVKGDGSRWTALAETPVSLPCYPAWLDVSALSAPGLLLAVHEAAVRFSARHERQACLTLLLPRPRPGDWQAAGDHAAAVMLVSTLACEWGSRALRINALEVPDQADPQALHALVRFVSGASAQYLTGQTLVCNDTSDRAIA